MRRRPAEGQEPVATLFYHGNQHAPLYEVEASQELPPLSPGRLARWTADRTCARCAAVSGEPLQTWDNHNRRLCDGCWGAQRLAEVRPSHLKRRLAAVDWARGVLADPAAAVLVSITTSDFGSTRLYGAELDGTVLIDVTVAPRHAGGVPPVVVPDGAVPAPVAVAQLLQLGGRRFIHHAISGTVGDQFTPVGRVLLMAGQMGDHRELARSCRTYDRELGTDTYRLRLRDWHCQTAHPQQPWAGEDGLKPVFPTAPTARRLAEDMLTGLRAIAADEHPDGPATCPVLPDTGLEPCGSTDLTAAGVCPAHQPQNGDNR
ncbi:hypothetical protein ABZS66_19030 [Dactylosporangium sp. NPDC005572]|uniref:hypothetical protein n=1 Tax=Dactylosporangium sp. NPDC005572 TaxID=3156889 RepID=UPI0033ADC1F9